MSLEISRLLLVSIPPMILFMFGGLIILEEDIKKFWPQVVLFGIIGGSITWSTNLMFDTQIIRLLANTAASLLLVKYLFHLSWWPAVKIFSTFWLFGFFMDTLSVLIAVYSLETSIPQVANNVSIWIKFLLPVYFVSPLIAYLIRNFFYFTKNYFNKTKKNINFSQFPFILSGVFIQTILLMAFFIEVGYSFDFQKHPILILITMITFFVLIGLNLCILFIAIKTTEEKIISAAENTMLGNIMNLVNSVRSQRHDFINHLQVINGLFGMEKKEELTQYLSQLTREISQVNDFLKIDNPFIGALLNTKITLADLKGIKLDVELNANLKHLSSKALDLTRVLGNLIDNALDAVESFNQEKWVKVTIETRGPLLIFSVTNPGSLPAHLSEKIFTPGFTTKGEGHSGLGLYICSKLAQKLHGKLDYSHTPHSGTKFSLIIPNH